MENSSPSTGPTIIIDEYGDISSDVLNSDGEAPAEISAPQQSYIIGQQQMQPNHGEIKLGQEIAVAKDTQTPTRNVPIATGSRVGGEAEYGVLVPPLPDSKICKPIHPRYASEKARLDSFEDWPKSLRQKPEELVEAGFFYAGQDDLTKCFYCDGGLKDWEHDDEPWTEHARWYDRCAFVQLMKGHDFIKNVKSEQTQNGVNE